MINRNQYAFIIDLHDQVGLKEALVFNAPLRERRGTTVVVSSL
jgi:hypothetical protein